MVMFLLRRTLCLLATLTTLSCNSLETAPDTERLTILTALDKFTLSLDETMAITITVHNVGFDPLVLTGASDCLIYIEVRNTDGERPYTSASQCSGNNVTEEIAPGEERIQSFIWDGRTNAGIRVPSGHYLIRPVVMLASGARPGVGEQITVE
jgi:hypothetical protein